MKYKYVVVKVTSAPYEGEYSEDVEEYPTPEEAFANKPDDEEAEYHFSERIEYVVEVRES